jgi:hypothetical protein
MEVLMCGYCQIEFESEDGICPRCGRKKKYAKEKNAFMSRTA